MPDVRRGQNAKYTEKHRVFLKKIGEADLPESRKGSKNISNLFSKCWF